MLTIFKMLVEADFHKKNFANMIRLQYILQDQTRNERWSECAWPTKTIDKLTIFYVEIDKIWSSVVYNMAVFIYSCTFDA